MSKIASGFVSGALLGALWLFLIGIGIGTRLGIGLERNHEVEAGTGYWRFDPTTGNAEFRRGLPEKESR